MKKFAFGLCIGAFLGMAVTAAAATSIAQRLTGRILLAVEDKGKTYFVHTDGKRYRITTATALEIFKKLALGIKNSDLSQIPEGNVGIDPETGETMTNSSTSTSNASTTSKIPAGKGTVIAGCDIFPADNAWNQDVSALPVRADSDTFINAIGASTHLHPDFGEDQTYGIPYNVVPGSQPKVPITFTAYGDESDPGPYPIPDNAKVEAPSDSHVLVLDSGACKLYEMYNAHKNSGAGWSADSGAVWNLKTGALRPFGWTSADAAGLPILAGLIRADEVAAGEITHAIRFTARHTQQGYILPATHQAGLSGTTNPPMGLRVRMKADYDISGLTGQARIIAVAMKKYGMILADNGSSWYFQGATDTRWNDDELNQLKGVPGSAFEAVDTGDIIRE